MKLIDIKGKRDYVRFILDDGSFIHGNGEMLVHGFCVYENSLKHFLSDVEFKNLNGDQLLELKEEIARLTQETTFNLIFQ